VIVGHSQAHRIPCHGCFIASVLNALSDDYPEDLLEWAEALECVAGVLRYEHGAREEDAKKAVTAAERIACPHSPGGTP
jgi:hypothetical protein